MVNCVRNVLCGEHDGARCTAIITDARDWMLVQDAPVKAHRWRRPGRAETIMRFAVADSIDPKPFAVLQRLITEIDTS